MILPPHPLFVLGYVGCLAAVVVLSLIPSPNIPGPEGSDKALHLLAYGAIAFCGGLGFRTLDTRVLSASAAFGTGIVLEFLQVAWFGRQGSIWDATANGAGVCLGLAAAYVVLVLLERWSERLG